MTTSNKTDGGATFDQIKAKADKVRGFVYGAIAAGLKADATIAAETQKMGESVFDMLRRVARETMDFGPVFKYIDHEWRQANATKGTKDGKEITILASLPKSYYNTRKELLGKIDDAPKLVADFREASRYLLTKAGSLDLLSDQLAILDAPGFLDFRSDRYKGTKAKPGSGVKAFRDDCRRLGDTIKRWKAELEKAKQATGSQAGPNDADTGQHGKGGAVDTYPDWLVSQTQRTVKELQAAYDAGVDRAAIEAACDAFRAALGALPGSSEAAALIGPELTPEDEAAIAAVEQVA